MHRECTKYTCLCCCPFPFFLTAPTQGRRCAHCGGELADVLLDWEDELRDYDRAVDFSNRSVIRFAVSFSPVLSALCLAARLCRSAPLPPGAAIFKKLLAPNTLLFGSLAVPKQGWVCLG